MPDSKLSDRSAVNTIEDTDEYLVARSGTTRKITGANLKAQVTAEATNATQAEFDAHVNDTLDAHNASAVSFAPTGTIAATDVQAAIAEAAAGGAYNVLDYGATGDSTTNDTAAIHATRDAAGVNGTVRFPAGTYSVVRLDADVAGQTWILERGCTIKLRNTTNDMVIRVAADYVTIKGPGIVDGNKANNTIANYGVMLYHCTGSVVDGITLQNTQAYGLMAYGGTTRCKFLNNTVLDTDTVAIYVDAQDGDCVDTWIIGNYVNRVALGAGILEGGIQVHDETHNCYRTKIHDNYVVMPTSPSGTGGIGIEVFGSSPYSTIHGNHVVDGSISISVDASDSCSVIGNVCYGPTLDGIEVANSNNCTLGDNTIDGATRTDKGIVLQNSTPDSNIVDGNTIRNLKSTGTGIEVSGGQFNVVSGNNIDATTFLYGITLTAAPRSTVTGNAIGTSLGLGIRIINSSDWTVVSGNTFYGSGVASIQLGPSSANLTITGNVMLDSSAAFIEMSSGSAGANVKVKNNIGNGTGNNTAGIDYEDWQAKVLRATGTGSPEGALAAGVGSEFIRTDGGAATSRYFKESGTGNTGWVGK